MEDELVKVSLSIYDTDGLEGLYVPISQFRETSKDVAGRAMHNTGHAISKAIKKNKVKLKYGTFVYLVNGRENRN